MILIVSLERQTHTFFLGDEKRQNFQQFLNDHDNTVAYRNKFKISGLHLWNTLICRLLLAAPARHQTFWRMFHCETLVNILNFFISRLKISTRSASICTWMKDVLAKNHTKIIRLKITCAKVQEVISFHRSNIFSIQV